MKLESLSARLNRARATIEDAHGEVKAVAAELEELHGKPFPLCPVDRADCTSGAVCCRALGGTLEHLTDVERSRVRDLLLTALATAHAHEREALRALARKFEGTDKTVFVRNG